MSLETCFALDDMHSFEVENGIAILFGDQQEMIKEAQILRAAPKLFELVSKFVQAERERKQAEGKKIRALHEAEDLLKTFSCTRED